MNMHRPSGRPTLGSVAALWTGVLLVLFNVYAGIQNLNGKGLVANDFRLPYGAARLGLQVGWSRLYELPTQERLIEGMGFYWSPYLNPPPLAWLALPFTALPFPLALGIWTVLLLASVVLAWWLVAPGATVWVGWRSAHLALALGWFPLAFGLIIGQPVALVLAAVAAAWWLLGRGRPVAAGLCLSLLALKPQLAILVPLALLAGRQHRAFAACAAGLAVLGLVSVLSVGPHGLDSYRSALAIASGWELTRRYALLGHLTGAAQLGGQAVVLGGTAALAWRRREAGPDLLIAAGLVGSILLTPYTGFQDLAMLVLAAWLLLRREPRPRWLPPLLAAGYVAGEFGLATGPWPLLAWEVLLWISLWWMPGRGRPEASRSAQV